MESHSQDFDPQEEQAEIGAYAEQTLTRTEVPPNEAHRTVLDRADFFPALSAQQYYTPATTQAVPYVYGPPPVYNASSIQYLPNRGYGPQQPPLDYYGIASRTLPSALRGSESASNSDFHQIDWRRSTQGSWPQARAHPASTTRSVVTERSFESSDKEALSEVFSQSSELSSGGRPGQGLSARGGNLVKSRQGSQGDSRFHKLEPLDKNFVQRKDGKAFFQRGKVFKVYWAEPAGQPNSGARIVRDDRHGEYHAVKIRWFVVIKPDKDHCTCLPISTYGQQGVSKRGVIKKEHSIICTEYAQPSMLETEFPAEDEEGMKPFISVVPTKPLNKIDKMSRINYAKVYTVEHNVKAYDVGNVHANHVERMKQNFELVFFRSYEDSCAASLGSLNLHPEDGVPAASQLTQDQYSATASQSTNFSGMHYNNVQANYESTSDDLSQQYAQSVSSNTPVPLQESGQQLTPLNERYLEANVDPHRAYRKHLETSMATHDEVKSASDAVTGSTPASRSRHGNKSRAPEPKTTMSSLSRKGKGKAKVKE